VIAKDSTISVVTSFSILEDLVNQLGGQHVNVVNLVGRNSDAHMYQPKPSDAVAIVNADLLVFNGLEFEGWISRLIANADYQNRQLVASNGVNAITNGAEIDPHAWQSFHNIRIYIDNITQTLIELRPQHTFDFKRNKQRYLDALFILESQLIEQISTIPRDKRIVVTSHDAFGYLGREFSIDFVSPVGLNIEIEASAEDVAAVIDQVRADGVTAIFVENITNSRLLQSIADETNIRVGGRLYSDALSELEGT
ncbi:zinc ABC transporter substrate-binding protein, partial [Porticoccaceae bacterium]|nr:zinc ABC transporter substrate-binding protein [Porticoccaceae bacterium]